MMREIHLIRFEKLMRFISVSFINDYLILTPEEINISRYNAALIKSLKYSDMKKIMMNPEGAKQNKKYEMPTSQKPGNEKPLWSAGSLDKAQMKGRSDEEIMKHQLRDMFGKAILSDYARSHYAPGEKPW